MSQVEQEMGEGGIKIWEKYYRRRGISSESQCRVIPSVFQCLCNTDGFCHFRFYLTVVGRMQIDLSLL